MIEAARMYHERTFRSVTAKQLTSKQYEAREIELPDMMAHLKWMCEEIMSGKVAGSKARAWIGYIQGELRAAGIFNIMQMREQSREALGTEYCCGFAMFGSEVALVTKAKPDWQRGKLNGIGGKVENGETAIQAMVREFKEETGVDHASWEHFVTLHTKGTRIQFFRAELALRHPIEGLPEEPVRWWAIQNVLNNQNKIPNLNWLIPAARTQRGMIEVWE